MSYSFNPTYGLIPVYVEVEGPAGPICVRLVLDTGASRSAIDALALMIGGYDPAGAGTMVPITTASGIVEVPLVKVTRMKALGLERSAVQILAHTLPATSSGEGVLGLDFFQGTSLTIDFRQGLITVS
jgi:predicted aspartyl protease